MLIVEEEEPAKISSPSYAPEDIVLGKYKIFERIGWDDNVGATYLALGRDNKELVLRVAKADQNNCSVVRMEAEFLCQAEQDNKWRHFSQVEAFSMGDDDIHCLTLYFRHGPTLEECFKHCKGRFSHGSAGRLAFDILQILRTIHSMGYLLRCLDLSIFHFDASSRHLFLADLSSLQKDVSKLQHKLLPAEGHAALANKWAASPDFRPHFYSPNPLTSRGELEAWLYMFIYMHRGSLPWDSMHAELVDAEKKRTTEETAELFEGLPKQYKQLWQIICNEQEKEQATEEEYETLGKLVIAIYREVGGVEDEEVNFDYEREPTEDELPKFVAERVPLPVVEEEAEQGQEEMLQG